MAGRGGIWIARLTVALVIAALISIAGIVISALGAPEPGVIDDWGRIDDIGRRAGSWEYVLVGIIGALAFVAWGRGNKRAVLGLLLGYLGVIAVAVVLGILALFERQTLQLDGLRPTMDYYTATERTGEIIVFAGVLLAIATIFTVLVALLRTSRPEREASAE